MQTEDQETANDQPAESLLRGLEEGPTATQLASLTWSDDADPRLRAAAEGRRRNRFLRRLAKVGLSRPGRLPAGVTPAPMQMLWLLESDGADALEHLTRELLHAAADGRRDELDNLCAALLETAEPVPVLPREVLAAWLALLPSIGRRLERGTLWRLWRRTLDEVEAVASAPSLGEADPTGTESELRDEILFRAGIVFRPLAAAADWLETARTSWRTRVAVADDGEPLPHLRGEALLAWLGSLTRVTTAAAAADVRLWRKRERAVLRSLCLRLCAGLRPDGTLAGVAGPSATVLPLLQSLGVLCELDRRHPAARLLRSLERQRPQGRAQKRRGLDQRPGFQSDAWQVALLRDHWGAGASLARLDFSRPQLQIEVVLAGEPWLTGIWDARIHLGGQSVDLSQPWECECWYSDEDADFVELTKPLGQGVTLLRQVLLGRRDELLLMAEAVRGAPHDLSVEVASSLPLRNGLSAIADGYSRELQVLLAERRVRLFPVHLPWERAAKAEGVFRASENGLTLQMFGAGSRAQVLMAEWSRLGAEDPADGGPVTVAEDLRRLRCTEACAGRLRVGGRQWLYLHNLTRGQVPRSVLGCHSASETVIGRLGEEGKVEYLVHVEGRAPDEIPEEN